MPRSRQSIEFSFISPEFAFTEFLATHPTCGAASSWSWESSDPDFGPRQKFGGPRSRLKTLPRVAYRGTLRKLIPAARGKNIQARMGSRRDTIHRTATGHGKNTKMV